MSGENGADGEEVTVSALVSGLEGRHVFTYHIAHPSGNYLVHGFHKKREAMQAMPDLQERVGDASPALSRTRSA